MAILSLKGGPNLNKLNINSQIDVLTKILRLAVNQERKGKTGFVYGLTWDAQVIVIMN